VVFLLIDGEVMSYQNIVLLNFYPDNPLNVYGILETIQDKENVL
jgi:hypothetical protein